MVNAEGIASGSSAVGGAGADFKEPRERSGNGKSSMVNGKPGAYESNFPPTATKSQSH
jgi:hypothetical protein